MPSFERPPEDDDVRTLFLFTSLLNLPSADSIADLRAGLGVEDGNSDFARLCLRISSGDLFRPVANVLPEVVEARGLGAPDS